ncbi:hypothetical protein ILFOPFJJ_01065 [Ensifer psoraleae]|nr:hypothetical protein [Sinorhizobium psoraleae]
MMTSCNRDKAGLSRDSPALSHRHIASEYRIGLPGRTGTYPFRDVPLSRPPMHWFVFIRGAHAPANKGVMPVRNRVLCGGRPSRGTRSPGFSICEEK